MRIFENLIEVTITDPLDASVQGSFRVWWGRVEAGPRPLDDDALTRNAVAQIPWSALYRNDPLHVAELLYSLVPETDRSRLNAIQVTTPQGISLLYPEWP